ncbi:MAG: acyl-CoA dehydrogenase [Pseudonocardiaceae bacterium]|nr:acyl-CoA dehydrogenase [Pseudonocardiaceae bacterium]
MHVAELFAPPAEVAAHPAVTAARRLCDELLEPHAAAADDPARGVRREHLDALADAGLFSMTVPTDEGGLGASAAVDREVIELLAGACGATWFVLTQHETPQNLVRGRLPPDPDAATAGPAATRHHQALCDGSALAGIALAHLRRPGPPAVTAEPDGRGGYLISGRSDWCTGWGLVDVLLLAATGPDGEVVFGLIEATERAGLRPGAPLPLAVMGGTATVALEFDRCRLGADEVALTMHARAWPELEAVRSANTRPASLGLLRRMLVELERLGHEHDRPEGVEAALELVRVAVPLRAEAYALLDTPARVHIARRTQLRGTLAELTVRAAAALVATRSGSAMLSTSPEQRWAREAAFHLVQAQNPAVRTAQLGALARGKEV